VQVNETDEEIDADFKSTMDAYRAATDDETKYQIWLDFLKRNPDNKHTFGTVQYLAQNYFLEFKDDPDGAIAFAQDNIANLSSEKDKAKGNRLLLSLYSKSGKGEQMHSMVDEMTASGEINLDDARAITDAAVNTEQWEMLRDYSLKGLDMLTPEQIRANAGDRELTDEQVERYLGYAREDVYTKLGWAHANLGEVDQALQSFKEAEQHETFNIAGVAYSELSKYWAKTLLNVGDYEGAMEKIAPEAITFGDEKAFEIYKKAYLAGGGDESALESNIAETRERLARRVPDFAVFDYEGNKVQYADLKGKVTLLAFWFPT
jgi:tetratricopeptide (TPR) repeat protein